MYSTRRLLTYRTPLKRLSLNLPVLTVLVAWTDGGAQMIPSLDDRHRVDRRNLSPCRWWKQGDGRNQCRNDGWFTSQRTATINLEYWRMPLWDQEPRVTRWWAVRRRSVGATVPTHGWVCPWWDRFQSVQGPSGGPSKKARNDAGRASRESEALTHDRFLYPRQIVNHRGQPVFDLSPAKLLLRQDVADRKHLVMTPSELRQSRIAEYGQFGNREFKHRIYQAVRREKFINWLEQKRQEKYLSVLEKQNRKKK